MPAFRSSASTCVKTRHSFLATILQDMPVNPQILHRALELRGYPRAVAAVRKTRSGQAPHTSSSKDRNSDAMLAADFRHRLARLCLTQYSQNLLFAVPSLAHLPHPPSNIRESLETLDFKKAEFLVFQSY
jgi:hypothetical protein